ncbi:MAG: hypothetical protein JSR39_10410, partial [Verrucomicrobia bacterium]|nr:hypothetical protein [Verrucomicrobiota bacterium]
LTLEGGAKDSRISVLEREALAAAEQQRLARLEIDRLTLEGGTKDSSIVDLTRQVREAADLQRDALAEIQRLKREGGTKDSRISDLEREALVAAEQQRLARDEIDRLTLEGGTKDSRISALERDVRKAADLQRDALAEIDRLKREGGTKDLRIADLEQEGGRKDVRIGELEKTIRRLEEELKAAKADWAEKERLHGVAIDEKNARIEEIDQEYRLLQLQKQELQEKYEKLIDESDRNDRALKARIAELEKGIRPLLTKLQDTEFALQEAQAKLEAGTRNFDEMKQRWLKTKQALDEATRIKSALEEESTQHAKAEQAWEKERQRLERAVAAVKEESRLTGVENTELRSNLDNALQRLDAQVKANQRQNFASEKQARELQSTIESLSNDLQFEKERSDRFQRAQRETARRVEELEGQQKDLLRELQEATEERDELRAEYAKLEPQLNKQRDEFGQEIDRVHLEAEERHRAMLEDLERLDRHARALEEELALLRSQRSGPSLAPVDLSNPAAAVDEGREAARQLEEVVREISAEPIIFSRLEQSLIDGYHLNRQLSQVEEMAFDKSSGALRISITDNLARELRLPKVFSLKPGSNEASLGEEFNLSKKPLDRRRDSDRICRLMLIKRLQTIRGELMGAAKGADESKATPWRTWGEVFKNFTTFCKEMNRNLPTLRQHIANYKREFARLRVQGIDEAVLKQCVASRKIPAEINEPQRGEVAGLIRLYQTMAKSCEEIFLYSLPRKIPMHHAWKILMLTNHGLPDRAYEHGRLKPAEAEVVEPLQTLIPEFYRRFSSMLQSIQIDNGRIVE